jgi:aspartyl-tRNA(Asn)/glutamyl-tRNA(Gln) amidotransferase subunit B
MEHNMNEYEAIIGLETHIQLNTASKIFCSCKADSWEEVPNTNICPVCSGLPGVLPILNKEVVEKAVLLAKAMNSAINDVSFFDRKNYFYPDLPKGYQITQFDEPIGKGGYMDVPVPCTVTADHKPYVRRVGIWKLHMEEDAGKTKMVGNKRMVDFNRCGVPLIEMVTAPDIRSAEEAGQYLIRLRQLLRWIGISEANMERAHLRCDANVSIRKKGETILNTRSEIKNVNSIEAVKDAIEKEVERQIREVEAGKRIEAWTLEWDEDSKTLKKMRSKETEADYRYFREPDLLSVKLTPEWKTAILTGFPELPLARRERFITQYGLPEYDAEILTGERRLSDYYETVVKAYGGDPKKVSNWLMNEVLRMINEQGLDPETMALTPTALAEILKLVDAGTVNITTGRALLTKVQQTGKTPQNIVMEEGLAKVSDDSAIRKVCQEVLAESPNEVASYKAGKVTLIGWFTGAVMKKMRGQADAALARKILEELLK